MKNILKLIRVKHWVKNFLIFIPLITSKLVSYENVWKTTWGFIAFSLLASVVYIFNDLKDIELDKLHPQKKNRPLASGAISKNIAIYIAILMLIGGISINILINKNIKNFSNYFLGVYFFINLIYSWGMKNFAIIDIILLATGFVLRVYYGASLIDVLVSDWLFLTILSASLFLGLGKRKKELKNSKKSRKVLEEYNEEFLNNFQYLFLGLTLVFYSLWTINQNITYLYLTIPLVIIIFMRYCLIIEKSNEGDPTTIFYKDKFLIILCIFYGISMVLLLS